MPAIGIDFGTAFCCVGVMEGGDVRIISNKEAGLEEKPELMPSYVALKDPSNIIGAKARDEYRNNPDATNIVFSVKRFIGRQFNDIPSLDGLPFQVVNKVTHVEIGVVVNDVFKSYRPKEIAAMIFKKMKEIAESDLGPNQPVTLAVVSVPSSFKDTPRAAITEAATSAGFPLVKTITDTIAAVYAYSLDKGISGDETKNVFVLDIGGGFLDASIVTIKGQNVDRQPGPDEVDMVKSGGRAFTDLLVAHFLQKLGPNLSSVDKAKLRIACEDAKEQLTSGFSVDLTDTVAGSLFNNDNDKIIEREELESGAFQTYFDDIKKHINDVLVAANLTANQIKDVVLVGGSSRIGGVRGVVNDVFSGTIFSDLDPDQAIAMGATRYAAQEAGELPDEFPAMFVEEPIRYSLGIETYGGDMATFIERNTMIPPEGKTVSKIFTTTFNNQESVMIQIYEGESARAKENTRLKQFRLSGITRERRGVPQIKVTFQVSNNGPLEVTAVDLTPGKTTADKPVKISVTRTTRALTNEEKARVEADTKRVQAVRETLEARRALHVYMVYLEDVVAQGEPYAKKLEEAVKKAKQLFGETSSKEKQEASAEDEKKQKVEYENQKKALEKLANDIRLGVA